MLAVAFDQMTWTLVGVVVLLAAWVFTRVWIQRGAAKTFEMRKRLTDGSLSPRGQHYYFTHAALRALAAEDPERLITVLASPDADEFLLDLWKTVKKDAAQSGDDSEDIPPEGLQAIPARVANRPAALVTLPTPRAATEAWFVAIVLNHDLDDPAKPAPEPEYFYYTLEKGFSLDNSPRTAFCEWDDAAHKNFGDGPPPDPRAFLDFIADRLHAAAPENPRASFHPGKHNSHRPPKNT